MSDSWHKGHDLPFLGRSWLIDIQRVFLPVGVSALTVLVDVQLATVIPTKHPFFSLLNIVSLGDQKGM